MRTGQLLLVVGLSLLAIASAQAEIDASLLAGMEARAIGPAGPPWLTLQTVKMVLPSGISSVVG